MDAPSVTLSEHPDPAVPTDAFFRRRALLLEWATIAWNALEVVVTVALGLAANSLALVAFGMDSLVEIVASFAVVWHMTEDTARTARRRAPALRLVALAFALLAAYLMAGALHAVLAGQRPDSSPWGMAYLAATAVAMFVLARVKRSLGDGMSKAPFVAETSMTFLDGCLAVGVLAALAATAAFGWWWADSAAAGLIAVAAASHSVRNFRAAGQPADPEM